MNQPAESANSNKKPLDVLIVGSGFGGLCMAIKLAETGNHNFALLEKASEVGGTWRENSYPGARVDVANHFYCYSFEPSNHWDHFFAEQPELRRYFADVVCLYDPKATARLSDW